MVSDVTEATFQRDVIDRSHEVPVLVDFWAAWCGPCRQLTPVLERAVTERGGRVELAKVDTDANQRLAQQFGIQGIPAVKAFKDGVVVEEFTGALPPRAVEEFLDRVGGSEADDLIAAGDEEGLRRALELQPTRPEAALPLARLLHARGADAEAITILDQITGSFAAEGLAARLRLRDDPELAPAWAQLDAGETEAGLDALLAAIGAAEQQERRDALRQVVVGVLDELGVEHPLARDTRRRLADALYARPA